VDLDVAQIGLSAPVFQRLVEGNLGAIDVADWKANSEYRGELTATDRRVKWFWNILENWDDEKKRAFLSFSTGSSVLPPGGFAKLRGYNGQPHCFTIALNDASGDNKSLPRAESCFNMFKLPNDPKLDSQDKLEERLNLFKTSEGFQD